MPNTEQQIQEIVNYMRRGEKGDAPLKIGLEVEHLVLDKDTLTAVSYYQRGGIADILKEMQAFGWQGVYEKEHLLGLLKDGTTITLEPGGQLEISIKPHCDIAAIEEEYISFLEELLPILEANNQLLAAVGYHPVSKIADIEFIPKERYAYMSRYLKRQGRYALNMMKGTAAMHVNIDYRSEEDYVKKHKIANCLGPVVAVMFDNAAFFEGEINNNCALKRIIWQNCDDGRCGMPQGTFQPDYGYRRYAEYILNIPAIVLKKGERLLPTEKQYKEVFDPQNYQLDELEYMMTMAFPDIRTKNFIEIRVADSVPYPLNIAGAALWKGLLYHQDNLNELDRYFADITAEEIDVIKKQIVQHGYDARFKNCSVHDLAKYIVSLAKAGLNPAEKKYLEPLERLVEHKLRLAVITRARLHRGRKEALNCCFLNNLLKGGHDGFPRIERFVYQSGEEGCCPLL